MDDSNLDKYKNTRGYDPLNMETPYRMNEEESGEDEQLYKASKAENSLNKESEIDDPHHNNMEIVIEND